MSYTNLNNPANYQLQSFGQDGMRTISTTQAYVEGEYYRVLVATEDSTLSATSMVGDDLASIDVYAGTTIYGLFTAVTVTAGEVTAYLAGRTDIDDVWAYIRAYGEANGATIEGEDCAKAAISPLLDKYYAQASLVMVPSLYKTSIVYSERPLSTDGELTFTRASNATRVGPGGLIEKVRTNLLLQSNSFDTTWTAQNATLTSGQSGYDGSSDAWKVEAATTSTTRLYQSSSIAANTLFTISLYAKVGNVDFVRFNLFTSGTNSIATFDLTDGTTISSNAIDTAWEDVGSGWVRISATFINVDTITEARIEVRSSSGTATCDAGSFVYIQNAQLETGDIATDYIATTTAAVSVGPVANVPRLDYLGSSCPRLLLEPQRTNAITFSEQMNNAAWIKNVNAAVTANQAISPDGYQNADLVSNTLVGGGMDYYQLLTGSASTTYTYSVFVKAATHTKCALRAFVGATSPFTTTPAAYFDLATASVIQSYGSATNAKIEAVGSNGWYRVSMTFPTIGTSHYLNLFPLSDTYTLSASNAPLNYSSTGGVYFWGAQYEIGAYATSYVNTLNSAVTRGADAASKTGISSLIGQTEGTMFVNAANLFPSGSRTIALLYTSGSAFYQMYVNPSNQVRVDVNGSFLFLGGSIAANTNYKIAFAYKSGEYALYINGTQIATSASTTMPSSLTAYYLGNSLGGEQGGAFSQALLFKTRLTNAQLAELTIL
jgi:hypothetical protein